MAMCRRNLFHYDLRVCTELKVLSKTASRLCFYAYKKYKNSNSARRTASQPHIRPSICYGGSDNFSSGISGKLPKIATSNAIFSRTADRITTKFCMIIKKITSNDIFQNCVYSCSTLRFRKHFDTVLTEEIRTAKFCHEVFVITKLNIPESSSYMAPLRAIVKSQYLHSIRCFPSLRNEKRHCCYNIITTISHVISSEGIHGTEKYV